MSGALRVFSALLFALLISLSQVSVPPAKAYCRPFPKSGERFFDIRHKGEALGEAHYSFRREGERLFVRVDVSYGFGAAEKGGYELIHHSEEVWQAGQLQSLISDTRERQEQWRLRMNWDGTQLNGESNGVHLAVSGLAIPSSLWHRDTPKSTALISSVDGFVRPLTVQPLGRQKLVISGGERDVEGYLLFGALERSLWYDENCQLVRVVHHSYDGRKLVWELRSPL